MLSLIHMLTLITSVVSFKKVNNIPTISYLDYKTPIWVYNKVYKENMYSINSKYHPLNRKDIIKNKYIADDEVLYNTIRVCNLPFGLIQFNHRF